MVAVSLSPAGRLPLPSAVDPAGDEHEHARRLYKWLKSGRLAAGELTTYDLGLLVRYYPDVARQLIPEGDGDE